MQDNTLTADDTRRAVQHEGVKAQVEGDVNAKIAERAAHSTTGEAAKIDEVAADFRGRALDETVAAERGVNRGRGVARGSQFLDYVFYVIYGLLAIRLVLALIAAQSTNGFVQFIHAVTGFLYAPFNGIVQSPTAKGGYTLALPIVIAIVVYMLLHATINGLLRMAVHRKTAI